MKLSKILSNFYNHIRGDADAIEIWDEEFAFLHEVTPDGFVLHFTKGDEWIHRTYMMYDNVWEAVRLAIEYIAKSFWVYVDKEELDRAFEQFFARHPEELEYEEIEYEDEDD